MTNPKRPIQVVRPGNPTPEQIAAEHYRAFSQQMQSLAQGFLYNMLHSAPIEAVGPGLVDKALQMAEHYMHTAGPAVKKAFDAQMALAAAEQEASEKAEKK